jgi:trans-2,3-dihydro-3-hydroxyanthranilate isomerase
MARSYRYLHYDVFTDHLFGGNQLAVVPDARGLATETMQAIAKEMNFSETTFVFPAERPDTDVRMRIFTPGDELPTAGHPTIGSTFALARAGVIPTGRERFVFGENIGPVPVTLTWKGESLSFVWMAQGTPTFGSAIRDTAAVATALTLDESLIHGDHPAQVVSCGVPFLFAPIRSRRAVDGIVVNQSALTALLASTGTGAHGVFVFSTERGEDAATVYSRMFAPDLGVGEDPATGIASGPLGSYLVRHGLVAPDAAGAILSLQGAKMGRPSHVHIAIGLRGGEIETVRVGGESVLAGEGILYI